jgi:hypothetical protein
MMKRLGVAAAIASLVFFVASDDRPARAESKALPGGKPVAAKITYGETMLILASDRGAAAVVFPQGTESSARYQFRYESKDGKVKENGSGFLVEKYKVGRPTGKAGEFELIDDGCETRLKAGPIEIEWSRCGDARGWIYYVPEKVHACFAEAKQCEAIDLKRFTK